MRLGRILGHAAVLAGAAWVMCGGMARAEEPYTFNVILPMSGGGSFLGKSEAQTLKAVEKMVNDEGGIGGRKVAFTVHDDSSNPQVAVQLVSEIAASRPPIIIGPSLTATCNAVAPLVKDGPVTYCLSPGMHPAEGSYAFSSSNSTHDLERVLVRYFKLKGWTRIAMMTSSDATGQDADRGMDEVLAEKDNAEVKMVARAHYNTSDVSVSAQMETIRAAQPQALFAWSTGAGVATIFKGMVQAGLDLPVGTTDGNMTHEQMTQYAAFLPKQLYIAAGEWPPHDKTKLKLDPAVEAVLDKFYSYLKAEQKLPDQPSVQIWDTVLITVAALRKTGLDATPAQLRDTIAAFQNFPGVHGLYDFKKTPQRGVDETDTLVTLWNPATQNWDVVSQPTGIPLAE